MYNILITDELLPEGLALLRAAPDVRVDDVRLSRAELLARIADYDAIIVRSGTAIDRTLIERGPRLRVIGRAGLTFENIDLDAATAHGVAVLYTPDAYGLATAEHTLALMLALCRHLPAAEAALKKGEWDRARWMGTQLHGKTLGLIGLGRVGQLVAERAHAFGMRVLAYDPYIEPEVARPLPVILSTFEETLTQADFISVHVPLTPETQALIGAAEIARMKPGARLINVARGAVVDEVALHAALQSGHIAGAALDVFSNEPPTANPLLQLPNVVVTPHIGASTQEAQHAVSVQIAQQVLDVLRGTDYRHVINLPFASARSFPQMRPYLVLAEKIGAVQRQLAGGRLQHVEVEVKGEEIAALVKPVAVALLTGLLQDQPELPRVNYINAPARAAARGLTIAQTRGLSSADYANLISCRVQWDGGERVLAGTLFGGTESRLVQMDAFRMEAKPEGVVLIMFSDDVPGVIGKVGTLLHEFGQNIAEWRLGRDKPGGTALSFINLDAPLSPESLIALRALPEVQNAQAVGL